MGMAVADDAIKIGADTGGATFFVVVASGALLENGFALFHACRGKVESDRLGNFGRAFGGGFDFNAFDDVRLLF